MSRDYSVDELAEMLTDQILKEQFLCKEKLKPIVTAFIKAFVNLKNVPKNYNSYESKSTAAKRQRTLEQLHVEVKFWLNIVRSLDPDGMDKYYKQSDAMLLAKGFIEIKE